MPKQGSINVNIGDKELREYFRLVETLQKIPKGKFHETNQELVADALYDKRFIDEFPIACEILKKCSSSLCMVYIEKIESFLDIIERERKLPLDSEKLFDDNTSIANFWLQRKISMFLLLFDSTFKDYYKIKYPSAYNILLEHYKNYLNDKFLVEGKKKIEEGDLSTEEDTDMKIGRKL